MYSRIRSLLYDLVHPKIWQKNDRLYELETMNVRRLISLGFRNKFEQVWTSLNKF